MQILVRMKGKKACGQGRGAVAMETEFVFQPDIFSLNLNLVFSRSISV